MKIIQNETNRKQEPVIERLAQYRVYAAMQGLADQSMHAGDRAMIGMRLRAIEREVRALPLSRERLFLELHYFEGHSVEHCAELMGISRSTAFRVRSRALDMLANAERRKNTMHA